MLLDVLANLTPDPSPASDTRRSSKIFMAGEGNIVERGQSPLSNYLPSLKQSIKSYKRINMFERGLGGEYKKSTICKQNLYQSIFTAFSILPRASLNIDRGQAMFIRWNPVPPSPNR